MILNITEYFTQSVRVVYRGSKMDITAVDTNGDGKSTVVSFWCTSQYIHVYIQTFKIHQTILYRIIRDYTCTS